MPSIRVRYQPPSNEADFELLCLKLLRCHWKCNQLDLYGRRGEAQSGVDIIELSGVAKPRAAQCKCHHDHVVIQRAEILDEIGKAKKFEQPLSQYWIMTSAKTSVIAQKAISQINIEHKANKLFLVELWTWNKIEDLMDNYPEILDDFYCTIGGQTVKRFELKLDAILSLLKHIQRKDGHSSWLQEEALRSVKRVLIHPPLPSEDLRKAYRESHPLCMDDLPMNENPVLLILDAVYGLAAFSRRTDDCHPLLEFTRRASELAGSGERLAAYLHLNEELAGVLGLTKYEISCSSNAAPLPSQKEDRPYVLVCCEPSLVCPQDLLVEAWIHQDGRAIGVPLEKVPWSKKNRREMLTLLYKEVTLRIPRKQLPIFEFVVPRSLIGKDFDQWEICLKEHGLTKIGVYCQVVTRFLERRNIVSQIPLVERWERICGYLQTPCCVTENPQTAESNQAVSFWAEQPHSGDQLFDVVNNSVCVACVVFRIPPKVRTNSNKRDAMQAMLATGVPFALWTRTGINNSPGASAELLALVRGKPLSDLPRRVFEHRKKSSNKKHDSSHITLVWDDPYRLPPDPQKQPRFFLETKTEGH